MGLAVIINFLVHKCDPLWEWENTALDNCNNLLYGLRIPSAKSENNCVFCLGSISVVKRRIFNFRRR